MSHNLPDRKNTHNILMVSVFCLAMLIGYGVLERYFFYPKRLIPKLDEYLQYAPIYRTIDGVSFKIRELPDELKNDIIVCREDSGYLIFTLNTDLYGGTHVLVTTYDPKTELHDYGNSFPRYRIHRQRVYNDRWMYVVQN